jgi:hypothetical protein
MKYSGTDKYGLPLCGNKKQEKLRNSAMNRYNKAIRDENKKIEKANELRFYRSNGTATQAQLKKLAWLESNGY